jgi:hypothetical protein
LSCSSSSLRSWRAWREDVLVPAEGRAEYIGVHLRLKSCSQLRALSSRRPPVEAGGDHVLDWGCSAAGPPNLRLPPRTCAGRLNKQTQFEGGLRCEVRSVMCKTNPICYPGQAGGVPAGADRAEQSQFPAGRGPRGIATRGKCAKRTQFGPAGQPGARVAGRPRRGTMAPNKANFGRNNGRGKCLAGKELWYIAPAIGFGKTKPILQLRIGAPGRSRG